MSLFPAELVGAAANAQSPPALARRRRRWWLACALAVIGAVAITVVNLADHYQPLTAGHSGAFSTILAPPGLPAGQGIREVNTLGRLHEDFYVPPQRGIFWLLVDVENERPEAVTITSIRVPPYAPLWMAGTVRYAFPSSAPGAPGIPAPTRGRCTIFAWDEVR